MGYANGDRTFFLNSQNGSALFGKSNAGQIVIDPNKSGALIYSGNFWKNYTEDGLPDGYTYRTERYIPSGNGKGEGLLIDLSRPEIFFGNGNFYVTKNGFIHAANGGSIGGWKIETEEITDSKGNTSKHRVLHSDISKSNGRITLDSGILNEENDTVQGPGKIYSHTHDELTKSSIGFYLSSNGLSIGNRVKITNEGIMYLGAGAVVGERKHWIINGNTKSSYIAYAEDSEDL